MRKIATKKVNARLKRLIPKAFDAWTAPGQPGGRNLEGKKEEAKKTTD